jgi:hypothetical protein
MTAKLKGKNMIDLKKINSEYKNLSNIMERFINIKSSYNKYFIGSIFILPTITSLYFTLFLSLSASSVAIILLSSIPSMILLPILKQVGFIKRYNKKHFKKLEEFGLNIDRIKSEGLVENKVLENFNNELKKTSQKNIEYLNKKQDYIYHVGFCIDYEYQSFIENKILKEKILFKDIDKYIVLFKNEEFNHKVNKEVLILFIVKQYIKSTEKKEFLLNQEKLIDLIDNKFNDYDNKVELLSLIERKTVIVKTETKEEELKNKFINLRNKSKNILNKNSFKIKSI